VITSILAEKAGGCREKNRRMTEKKDGNIVKRQGDKKNRNGSG